MANFSLLAQGERHDQTMGEKSKPSKRTALLHRDAVIAHWMTSLYVHAERQRGGLRERQSAAWLELDGKLTEPVGGVADVVFHLFPEANPNIGKAEIPAVGSFIRVKPFLDGVIQLSEREFDRALMLAAAGRIASCSVTFQQPRYGHALIANFGLSSDPPSP